MNESVKAFLEAAKADPELRERLSKMLVGELVAAAKEKGFELTEGDFGPAADELGEGDLENAAGGGGCYCPIAGGGGGRDAVDGRIYGCACVGYGQGGDAHRIDDFNCGCVIAGSGHDDQDSFTQKN